MAKIGRNDTCPCGSGKKYKRCCWAAATAPSSSTARSQPVCDCCVNRLNHQADHVLDLILAGQLDEAEILCHELIGDFPGDAEGIDLLSMICEARGERERALELLRQAYDIAHSNPDYDVETRVLMLQRIKELESERDTQPWAPAIARATPAAA